MTPQAAAAGALVERAVRLLLLIAMFLGALGLWIGVPLAVLWGLGQILEDPAEFLILALLAVPMGMAFFAFALAGLNRLYMRTGEAAPLDLILSVCAVIALLGLLAFMSFGNPSSGPVVAW